MRSILPFFRHIHQNTKKNIHIKLFYSVHNMHIKPLKAYNNSKTNYLIPIHKTNSTYFGTKYIKLYSKLLLNISLSKKLKLFIKLKNIQILNSLLYTITSNKFNSLKITSIMKT